jgi:hypothetical protein
MSLIAHDGSSLFAGYVNEELTGLTTGVPYELSVTEIARTDISTILSSANFPFVKVNWFAEIYFPDILANASKYKSAVSKFALGNYEIWGESCITDSGFLNYICQRTPNYNCWLNEDTSFAYSPFDPTILGSVSYFFTLGNFYNGNMRKGNGISLVGYGAGYTSCVVTVYYIAQLVEFFSTIPITYSAEI